MELNEIRDNLNNIREDKELWSEFKYSSVDNYSKRYALAIELQYDLLPNDKELIKFLMENEIESRANDPFQGIGEALNLLSYLLASFRDPKNVWLFEKAKCANFDTFCGYDSEFIFSAGVEATCHYLDKHKITEDNHYLFERKDSLRTIFTEVHISEFFDKMKTNYPESITEESIESMLDRAIQFENYNECERLFALLEEQEQTNMEYLFYYAKAIRNYKKAVYYKTKQLETVKDAWNKASSLLNLATVYYLDSDYTNAYKSAKKWHWLLWQFKTWKKTGLGRMMAEAWYDICLGFYNQGNINYARICFKKGDYMLRRVSNPSLVLLEKANSCCIKLDIKNELKRYNSLYEEEKKRVDILLN